MRSFLFVLMGAVAGAILVWYLKPQSIEEPSTTSLTCPIEYNCKLSGGEFKDGACVCPIESFQTQEEMYDPSSGFCQTVFGGPGGDAFFAVSGLPHGELSFWNDIIVNLCEQSGGSMSGAACICPTGKAHSKTMGQCVTE